MGCQLPPKGDGQLVGVVGARHLDSDEAVAIGAICDSIIPEIVMEDAGLAAPRRSRGGPVGRVFGRSLFYPSAVATQWTVSDAWVFSAIEGTGPDDGCTLAQIISKADGINHAVLTEAEFTCAVPRLVAAGLIGVQVEADRYWHTEAGQALYRRWMNRGGLFSWIDVIPPALRRLGEPQNAAWSLPADVFDRAVQEHLQWAKAITRRLGSSGHDPADTL